MPSQWKMSVKDWKTAMKSPRYDMKRLALGLSQASIDTQQTKEALIRHAKDDPALRGLLFQHDVNGDGKVTSIISDWANTLSDFALAQEIVKKKIKNKDFRPEDYGIDDETFRKMVTVVEQAEKNPMDTVEMELHKPVLQRVEEYVDNFNFCYFRVYADLAQQEHCSHWIMTADNLTPVYHYNSTEHEEDTHQLYTDRYAMNWFATKVSHILMKNLEWDNCILWKKYVEKMLTTAIN